MISRFVGSLPWYLLYYNYMTDLQNDMLMWHMIEAKGVERSIEGIARRMLALNFASIHTSALASVTIIPSPLIHF